MTATRLLTGTTALFLLCACFPDRALEVRTISLDHLTAVQAKELAAPYLSKDGLVFSSKETLNAITVKDHSRNVDRIWSMLASRDASPTNIALHFQVIRATETGEVGPGLDRIAEALGELLRFKGYELMSEAVVSASERGVVEQSLDGGGMPLSLGVRINDIRGSDNNGSAELTVDLRRPGGSVLATNVVVPMGQTVVLGSAYPGSDGRALILTVRGELGSEHLRSSSRGRRSEEARLLRDVADEEEAAAGAMEAEAAAAADIHVKVSPATRVEIVHPPRAIERSRTKVIAPRAPTATATTPPPAR